MIVPDQLANLIFDWIETWYNPRRRHSYCEMLSPVATRPPPRHDHHTQPVRQNGMLKSRLMVRRIRLVVLPKRSCRLTGATTR